MTIRTTRHSSHRYSAFSMLSLVFLFAQFFVRIEGVQSQEQQPSSLVVTLNDQNFEHLTQATSGATTGKWFIKFYAPCKPYIFLSP